MVSTGTLQPSGASTSPALAANRSWLFTASMGLLLANAAAARAIDTVARSGPVAGLLAGLGHSWAFWLASAVTLGLALREPAAPARPRDLWICAGAVLAALIPVSQISAAACTVLAAAVLLDRTQGRFLKAAAMVLLAISVQLLWARLLMLFFVQPIATVDAHMVGFVIDRPAQGHQVAFVDGSHTMSILDACTSVQNASVAMMLYVAIVRAFRPEPRAFEAWALAGVFLSVVLLNVARLALMAQNIEMYHYAHGEVGAGVINAVITLAGLGWAVASVRREIFA